MIESALIEQVRGIYAGLTHDYTLHLNANPAEGGNAAELAEFVRDFASASPRLTVVDATIAGTAPSFSISRNGVPTGITFQGTPGGHEFTSLLLAIFNADGQGKTLPDATTQARIRALQGPIELRSFVSLTCTNCPDVVQALNQVAIFNPDIKHTIIVGEDNEAESKRYGVQAVPTVFEGEKQFHVGRGELGELLDKLEASFGGGALEIEPVHHTFDVVVMGGGPAGVAAAVYSARKGLNVAIVSENVGGQVKETVAIENLISVPKTTGAELANALRLHAQDYPISIFENRRVNEVVLTDKSRTLKTAAQESFEAQALIVATGAKWRKLNVPGEADYIGKGVAFCPHCDGPLFKDKHVAVVGGGNSGIEAAIDLAGICAKVTVVEFMDELKADRVLQDKLATLPNVELFKSTASTEVIGDGYKVTGLRLKDRNTEEERIVTLDGIFVQIGLMANTDVFKDKLELNRMGEIVIDDHCRSSAKGVYAAGDCASVPYNQIIIAMGEGAKASLAAFEDAMRGDI